MTTRPPGTSADSLRDPRRLAAVRRTGLLDTGAEEEFDRLTRAAALALDAPLAFVTIVDDRRSFWKSCVGVEPPEIGDRQLPVEESLCHFGVSTGEKLVVPDTRLDARTRATTPVLNMGVQAWISVPIYGSGDEVLGSLCVGDLRTREWSSSELAILQALGEATTSEIALRDRAAEAMSLARTLQESLLPPAPPDLPGYTFAADYKAADDGTKLLGDFFDVFESSPETWQVLVGDVTGHGPKAAMIAARMRYALRAAAVSSPGPASILAQVNQVLLSTSLESSLCTVALASLTGEGRLRICTAGHPRPVLLPSGAAADLLQTSGPILGAYSFSADDVTEIEIQLGAGDALVLYTDGITESGRSGSMGEQGLLRALDRVAAESPERIARHVQLAAAERAACAARDDAAVVVLRRN